MLQLYNSIFKILDYLIYELNIYASTKCNNFAILFPQQTFHGR